VNKAKLNIRYHNPNTDEDTLKYISQVFIEASRVKFENILRETAEIHKANPSAEMRSPIE